MIDQLCPLDSLVRFTLKDNAAVTNLAPNQTQQALSSTDIRNKLETYLKIARITNKDIQKS
jgi:hypothetical protein